MDAFSFLWDQWVQLICVLSIRYYASDYAQVGACHASVQLRVNVVVFATAPQYPQDVSGDTLVTSVEKEQN